MSAYDAWLERPYQERYAEQDRAERETERAFFCALETSLSEIVETRSRGWYFGHDSGDLEGPYPSRSEVAETFEGDPGVIVHYDPDTAAAELKTIRDDPPYGAGFGGAQ